LKLTQEIEVGYRNIYLGISAGFVLFAGMVLVSSFFPGVSSTYSWIGSMPFLIAVFGYYEVRGAKKRLRNSDAPTDTSSPRFFGNRRMVILMFVCVVGSVLITGYVWGNPIQLTYSGYGVSFQYPPQMTVAETQIANKTMSEAYGGLTLSSRNGKEDEALVWVTNPTSRNASIILDSVYSSLISNQEYSNTSLGVKSKVTMSCGYEAVVQRVSLDASGKPYFMVYSTWYDSGRDKMYILGIGSVNSEYDCSSLRQRFFDSFKVDVGSS
jgi:hypothetical protein